MKLLFIHPNMPGQYRNLCRFAAQDKRNTVVFLTKRTQVTIPGIHKVEYQVPRLATPATHRYLAGTENAVLQGQEVWRTCRKLEQEEGFKPDIIVAHPGWGDCLYLKDLWPDVPLLSYFEFYYHAQGADVGFHPEEQPGFDDKAKIRTKNLTNLLNLESADWGVSPTRWQRGLHPQEFRHKISLLHDGVDTEFCRPDAKAQITLQNGKSFKAGDEVVTYIARNFEPYRGFPTFIQAAERFLKGRPNAHIIAVGADGVSYGKSLAGGQTYRSEWMKKTSLDPERIHFTGMLDYASLVRVMQVSAAHIYLTYPFVLSWSSMEAMAAGCLMIASDTQPVREIISDGENGLLADFFSPEKLAEKLCYALDNQEKLRFLREAARRTIQRNYSLSDMLPLHMELIEDVAKNGHGSAFEEKRRKKAVA
jgi:glycosyltransferase involved in cell wall biosynthesis